MLIRGFYRDESLQLDRARAHWSESSTFTLRVRPGPTTSFIYVKRVDSARSKAVEIEGDRVVQIFDSTTKTLIFNPTRKDHRKRCELTGESRVKHWKNTCGAGNRQCPSQLVEVIKGTSHGKHSKAKDHPAHSMWTPYRVAERATQYWSHGNPNQRNVEISERAGMRLEQRSCGWWSMKTELLG